MGLRRAGALLLTAALGAAVAVLPAIAGSETTPSIEAVNVGGGIYGAEHHWSPSTATIAVGASVALSNPSEVKHGVYWVGGPATPSCTAGVPVGVSEAASGVKWSGSCTFALAGVYTFYCTVHGAAMSARVTVGTPVTSTGSTTTTTPGGTAVGTATVPAPVYPGGEAGPIVATSPLGAPVSRAIRLPASAHGGTVRGSLLVSGAGAGGRLQVLVFVRRGARLVRVGRFVRAPLHAGTVTFSVALDAGAARVLRSSRRLALVVRIELRPLHGASLVATRHEVLHR